MDEQQPDWMAQHGWPFVEHRPDARCRARIPWRWAHPWAVVRWMPVAQRERYACACGRWVGLSQVRRGPGPSGPLRTFRTR